MKGELFQFEDPKGNESGLFYTEDSVLFSGTLLPEWYRLYTASEEYDIDGEDGFVDFVAERGYSIERVYINPICI
jgi:hypothetical protein